MSEVDPTYGLQNGFNPAFDTAGAFTNPVYDPTTRTITSNSLNGQYDSAGADVRLTQLRNLLVGTRPQTNPVPAGNLTGFPQTSSSWPMITDPSGLTNGDNNFVAYNNGQVYFMPNSIAEMAHRLTSP